MKKKATSPAAFPKADIGREMKGSDCVVECLIREGVDVVFAYPGGASMELHQSLTQSTIRTILPRHEQGGSFAAEGYARSIPSTSPLNPCLNFLAIPAPASLRVTRSSRPKKRGRMANLTAR